MMDCFGWMEYDALRQMKWSMMQCLGEVWWIAFGGVQGGLRWMEWSMMDCVGRSRVRQIALDGVEYNGLRWID